MRVRVPYFDVSKVKNIRSGTGTVVPSGATVIGSGEYGRVYRVTPLSVRKLDDILDHHLRGVWSLPRGDHVVLKVMKPPANGTRQWVIMMLRELFIQFHLSTAPSKTVHGKIFNVKKYVPTPYFGGYVPSTGEFIICMKLQAGVQLFNATLRNKRQYLEIERAYLSMLLNNVVHMDFHDGNVMVTRDGGVHLVDFGGAVLLSDTFRRKSEYAAFKRQLHQFLKHWPERVTYATNDLNYRIMSNLNTREAVENELGGLVSKSAAAELSEMRSKLQNRQNARNLSSRKMRIHYK